MLTLFDYLPSQNAWKVRALLKHLGQPYQQEFISIFEGEGQRAEFLAINPTGAVPAIKYDDGRTVAESNAILINLALDTPYLPGDAIEQAQVMQWLFFESDYIQASVATLRHWVLTGKDKNRSTEVLEAKRAASVKVLGILNTILAQREYLAGNAYTIADISVFAYVHLASEAGLDLTAFPDLQRWIMSVQTQPEFLSEVFPYSIDEHSIREL